MTPNKHHGSSFEDFLADDGILDDARSRATKKVIAAQIAAEMQAHDLTKTALAARMGTTRAQLDRLLDPDNDAVTLATLKRAAAALGRTVRLELG